MRTVVKELSYEKVMALKPLKIQKPLKISYFYRIVIKFLASFPLRKVNFKCNYIGMEKLDPKQPCMVIMNHSCFLDIEIAESVMFPRPLSIVCTSDGFVGKNLFMRKCGCISTNKFVPDLLLVRNMKYAVDKLNNSILMYPEASYSFDGTATTLSGTLPKCLKLLKIPVVMIKTYGAYQHNPLYNNLQKRKVNVSADVKYLLSPSEIKEKSVEELNEIINKEFSFDNWKWQRENKVKITEPFRADYLNRVLYKCPVCEEENCMEGKGISIICKKCNSKWIMNEYGELEGPATPFSVKKDDRLNLSYVPQWFLWERNKVSKDIIDGNYRIEADVDICMMVDTKAIYKVGRGHLVHTKEGFVLDGCDGKLHYEQPPLLSHSLYADYFWYEIDDVICIGNMKTLYYCFPKNSGDIVAKARLATEEIYKLYN